ncbi:MAG: M28 family peptidase [Gemmatimonadaceae bacterium]
MIPLSRLVLASLLVSAGCATAASTISTGPRTHAPRATSGEISAADLMTRLYIFADDSMLGRESGQLGNVRATNYIAAEMRRMGLQPAGENGTYFQTVPVEMVRLDRTRSIAANGTAFATGVDVLPLANEAIGGAVPQGTPRALDGAAAVYGGQLGAASMISPALTAGKVVVFSTPDGANGRDFRAAFRPGIMAQYGEAAGLAIVALDLLPPALLTRFSAPQERVRPAALTRAAPTIMLVTPAAAARLLGTPSLDGVAVGHAGAILKGNLEFAITPAPYPARNVIGILPGRDAALRSQYVAIGAHNDHEGIAPRPLDHDSVLANNMVIRRQGVQDALRAPTAAEAARIAHLRDSLTKAHGGARADSIYNGADDDGSGTVAMLEIAERFATASERPRRSLLFVSHTGEEKGLWGSEWFTDHPTVPRDSIVAQLNMDMVGRGKDTDIMGRGPDNVQLIGPRRLSSQLGATIDSVNAARTPHMDIDASFDANGHPLNRYCRSDHYMYARYGIPITYVSLGYHTDYHQVTDEPQYIDYDHMARIASFVHDIAEAVGNRPQRLVVDGVRLDPQGGCRQ